MSAPAAKHGPVLISVGTRPEIIKMAPVHAELRRRGVAVAWAHTGQHGEVADTLYRFFGIAPEHGLHLERGDGSLAQLTCTLMQGLSGLYQRVPITTATGIDVWAYQFGADPDITLVPIPGGDWLTR